MERMNRIIAMGLLLTFLSSCSSLPEEKTLSEIITTTGEAHHSTNVEEQAMGSTVPTDKTKTYVYPNGTSSVVKKNAETFHRWIEQEIEQAQEISRDAALRNSQLLNEVGIKEIAEMYTLEITQEGFFRTRIIDADEKVYLLGMERHGYISGIRENDINGDLVWIPVE